MAAQQSSRPDSLDKGKLRVFISYSRDDLRFADQLDAALNACGFDCVIDRHGISGGEDWKRRLGTLISDADTVVFVLSPTSARSEICAWEVENATRLGKRILPVNCRPLDGASPPPQLRDRNYIFFYEHPRASDSGFGTGLARLVIALNTDFDWLREHTRYLQRATEWDRGARPANRLLSGDDIVEAKAWAASRPKNAPEPTALHLDFIRASENEAEARSNAQREQLEEMAAAQAERETALYEAEEAQRKRATMARVRNIALVAVSIFAVLAVLLGLVAERQRRTAEEQQEKADKERKAAETVVGLLSDEKDGRSVFSLPDNSNKEDPRKLAKETIDSAFKLARRDLSSTRILWIDDRPDNNLAFIDATKDRLRKIGVQFEQSEKVLEAIERLKDRPAQLVISNYGHGRCNRDGRSISIAQCVLEGLEPLRSRPPILIYSYGIKAEQADMMKCRGVVAEAETPEVLFAWILRALDPNFTRSLEIDQFCSNPQR